MSNSSLVSYTRISPHRTTPRNRAIDTITIHCIVGQWTAKQGCDYFATTKRNCSANYVVGVDGSIGLSVEEKDRSRCSSNGANDHRSVTIEVASDTKHPYAVTDEAYEALIKLVADICRRNNIKELKWKADKSLIGKIDQQNMTVHRWFAAKACPGDYLYERHKDIADKVNALLGVTTKPKEQESPNTTFHVGDAVNFIGTKHYASSHSTNGRTCKPGKARITAFASSGKHTVHLVAITGGCSNVYGWVDASLILPESPNLVVGSRVKVNAGAVTYTGGKLSSFVFNNTYEVIQIQGNRVVIGQGKAVTAAVNKNDLTVV